MLGLSEVGNNWKLIIGNFIVVFGSSLVYQLYDLLPKGEFPSMFEFYTAIVTAGIATLAFYGLNRVIVKKEAPTQ